VPSIRRPEFLEALGALPFKVGKARPKFIHVPLSRWSCLRRTRPSPPGRRLGDLLGESSPDSRPRTRSGGPGWPPLSDSRNDQGTHRCAISGLPDASSPWQYHPDSKGGDHWNSYGRSSLMQWSRLQLCSRPTSCSDGSRLRGNSPAITPNEGQEVSDEDYYCG
jgi:hypothetical protein